MGQWNLKQVAELVEAWKIPLVARRCLVRSPEVGCVDKPHLFEHCGGVRDPAREYSWLDIGMYPTKLADKRVAHQSLGKNRPR